MPTFDEQWTTWEQARAERLEMGDDLDAPREVEHFAYFSRRRDAVAAAETLSAAGFEVALARHRFKPVLRAARTEDLADANVRVFLREVIDAVEGNGGLYDGWGGMVEAGE